MLFQRFAIEIEVRADGRLQPRPGAAWRPEPARGEASIHRRLAKLDGASPSRIAAFASTYGLLRPHGANFLDISGPESAAVTLAVGQEAADDSQRVEDWLDQGAPGSPPPGTEDTVASVAIYASLPDWFLDTFDAFLGGGVTPTSIPVADFMAIAVPAAAATPGAALQYLAQPALIKAIDPVRVRRALRINEWVTRLVAGLEEAPEALLAIGGVDSLLRLFTANLPEAYVIPELLDGADGPTMQYLASRATETVDDWHAAARTIGDRIRALDLIHAALVTDGVSTAAHREIKTLYEELSGYRSPLDLSAPEIAERVQPLLARSLEGELATLGAWPIPAGAPAGLYVRALAATWTELMHASTPKRCATPACLGAVPPSRNRRYCDQCRAQRERESVRRTRSRASIKRGSS